MKIATKIPMVNSFKLCLYGVFISLFILSCGASTTGTNPSNVTNSSGTQYTVTFNLNGGTGNAPAQEIVSGGMAVKPADPTRISYTFAGWYTSQRPADTDIEFNFQNTAITEAITLYAKWTATYTITFNLNGGTGNAPAQDIVSGGMASKPTDPTRTSYTFAGWYTSQRPTDTDTEFNFQNTAITKAINLYANWTRNTYVVTFNFNYDNAPTASTERTDATGKVTQANPTRTSFNFVGWYTNAAGEGTVVDLDTQEFLVDTTLYAKWTTKFTVNFVVAGGSAINPLEVDSGASVSRPADPTRRGHTFDNWYKDQALKQLFDFGSETITANTRIYAKWTRNTYTVTFDLNYDNAPTVNTEATDDTGKVTQANPTRTGYTFVGWYTNGGGTGTVVDLDTQEFLVNTTLYAKWTRNIYTVTFNFNYDNAPTASTERTDATGKVTQANPTRTSFNFVGWYTNGGGTGTVVDLDTQEFLVATTLYAKWIATYTITFDMDSGTPQAPSQTINYGTTVTEPTDPTRPGYTFDGWFSNPGKTIPFSFDTVITSDTTIYAKWTRTYTVSFDANGGTGAPSSVSVMAGSTLSFPTPPTRASMYFGGWYTGQQDKDQHGRTKHKASTLVTNDLTLYARWYTEQPADKAALEAIITAATADADLNHIDVRQVIDLANLFQYNTNFNGAISRWDVSEVTNMKGMFSSTELIFRGSAFNGELNNWDTGNVRDMSRMFKRASLFNQDIGEWNTGNVRDMSYMFDNASLFNQDIGGWNTGNVRDMSSMFYNAISFNKDIGEWNTGNVRDMSRMFNFASSFNKDIGEWNTSNVENMEAMFSFASSFNKDIGEWNTGNVRDMSYMFRSATSFNQDLTKWLNTANPSTTFMFRDAIAMTAANKACWMPAPVPSNC